MKFPLNQIIKVNQKTAAIAATLGLVSTITISSTNLAAFAAGWKSYIAGTINEQDVIKYHGSLNLDKYGVLTGYSVINYDHAEAICEAKYSGWDTWAEVKVKTNTWDWWHNVTLDNGENNWECWDSYWSW